MILNRTQALTSRSMDQICDALTRIETEIRDLTQVLGEPYDHDGEAGPDDMVIRRAQLDAVTEAYRVLYSEFAWRLWILES